MSSEDLWALVGIVVGVAFVFFCGVKLNAYTCESKAEMQGLQHDYGIITGCMVKVNNSWIDYNRLRYTDLEK